VRGDLNRAGIQFSDDREEKQALAMPIFLSPAIPSRVHDPREVHTLTPLRAEAMSDTSWG